MATSPLPSHMELMEQGIMELKKAANQEEARHSASDGTLHQEAPSSGEKSTDALAKLIKGEPQSDVTVTTSLPNVKLENKLNQSKNDTSQDSESKSKKRKRRIRKKDSDDVILINRERVRHDTGSNTSENYGDDEDIFNMDISGDENTESNTSVTRTVSLPIIQEKRSDMTDSWVGRQFTSDFHPFSDGDITPILR